MRRLALISVVALAIVPSVRASAVFGFFQLDVRSGALHKLAHGLGDDLSPDRTSSVYSIGGQLFVEHLDGSQPRLLADLPYRIPALRWSPDGKTIAFEIEDSTTCVTEAPPCGRRAIWLVNVDGSDLRQLVDNASDPVWSPDSRRLAFIGRFVTHTFAGNVSVENVDGGGLRTLTTRERLERLEWSPNGRWISYTQVRRAGHHDVVRIVPVSRPQNARTIARGDVPFWLDNRIAFIRYVATNRRALYVASVGARPRRILTAEDIRAPSPSPDARRIAYANGHSLVIVTENGRIVRTVLLGPGVVFGPIFWSHDGRSVFYTREIPGVPS